MGAGTMVTGNMDYLRRPFVRNVKPGNRVLIITDTPGVGHRARSVIVIDYDDWRALHQETGELG